MTTPAIHSDLAQGRWFTLSLAEQLGNVGSEYERVLSWKKKNNPEHSQKAFDRMLELMDLTISDPRWIHRLKELVRLRSEICLLLEPENHSQDLKKYFLQFATLARGNR